MVHYRVNVFPEVHQDVQEFSDYIINKFQNPIAARKAVEAIYAKIDSLQYNPKRIHYRDEYYFTIVKNYRIFYYIIDNEVFVFRVIHIRQMPRF